MDLGVVKLIEMKKSTLTPKAILHQKYGNKACYKIEQVVESCENSCPGLAIQQQGRVLFKCHLDLPGFSVVSDTFTRKKDAEQSAAKMALDKLEIQPVVTIPTPEEAWNELIGRVSYLFSNEFLFTYHPLTGHFREALTREGSLCGFIPISIIISYDLKTISLCKIINAKAELDPLLMMSLVEKAARLASSVRMLDGEWWMGKQTPYSPDAVIALVDRHPSSAEMVQVKAICIPSSVEESVKTITLNISSDECYLNEIASNLNVRDSSRVLLSRNIGKSSSDMRLFFPAPEFFSSSLMVDMTGKNEEDTVVELPLNRRATFISGQSIRGDAVMAVVAYKWNSPDLYYEHISLSTYYRLILNKVPTGSYKLSREAILAAKLPCMFTSRLNWRGSLPRDLLCMFCRHHRLSEPVFQVETVGSTKAPGNIETCVNANSADSKQNGNCHEACEIVPTALDGFRCEIKIFSRQNDLVLECPLGNTFKKQTDAVQSSALKILLWLEKYFKQLEMPIEKSSSLASSHGICINSATLANEFYHCRVYVEGCSINYALADKPNDTQDSPTLFDVEGLDSGNPPCQGSLVCISYSVALVHGENVKEILENKDNFDFEVGTGCVIDELEACVTQMCLNQSAKFVLEAPPKDLILAAAGDSAMNLSQVPLYNCNIEYSIKLLEVTEPLEYRLEQAFFSPPLSKQRVEFAVNCINGSLATTLVDFGCGSGSLLDSLLDQTTTLKKIVGVDISRKGLTRAAKIIHSKLSTSANSAKRQTIDSAELYDGSIISFDSRLYGYDIGTCLEVIEHMEENEATMFGELVLSTFCPRLLIVSTPNYEYNVILQKGNLSNNEEDPEDKSQAAPCRFRNHDHKFEWTRKQFQSWASSLASKHGYSVEFSGVGGSGEEPGFASQIAVFTLLAPHSENTILENIESLQPYEMVWQWKGESIFTT